MNASSKFIFVLGLSALALAGCIDKNKGAVLAAPQAAPQTPKVEQQESNRVCYVTSYDTRACKKGDTLLYLPEKWGNEQLPVDFASQKCDFSKQIVWTNGGVSCIYSGPKEGIDGAAEVTRISYSKLFEQVAAKPDGWRRFENSERVMFWRVVERGNGAAMQEGDKVIFTEKNCKHDFDGTEHLQAEFRKSSDSIDKLTKNHWLYMLEAPYGSLIEVVGNTTHYFMIPQKEVKKPAKKASKKK